MKASFKHDGATTLVIIPESPIEELALEEMANASAKGTSAVISLVGGAEGHTGSVTISMVRGTPEKRG
jgi:hypothetical protein